MKALPEHIPRGSRALRALGRRAILSPAPNGRRYLQAPRAVDNGTVVGNAAPLPAASASSGLSPTPGS